MVNTEQPAFSFWSTLLVTSKEARMGGYPFQEIPCSISANPVGLAVDVYADEYGRAVHEDCYVKHITSNGGDTDAR